LIASGEYPRRWWDAGYLNGFCYKAHVEADHCDTKSAASF
jgi:hypothetical protein